MCPERLVSKTNLAIIKRIIYVEQAGIPPKYTTLSFYLKIIGITQLINRLKKKNYVIISIITEMALGKIQHYDKTSRKNKRKFLWFSKRHLWKTLS